MRLRALALACPAPLLEPSAASPHAVLTSAQQEAAATHAEWERSVLRGNAARDAQLRFTQDHDLINKWPRVEQPPPPPPAKTSRTFGGGAPFHILSGEPIPVEQQSDAARALRPARPLADYRPSLVRRRAVDITSNEYLVDDAGRKARDEAAERERAVRRYWQTHNFDPLTQTYYDPDKEAAARHVAEASKSVQGLAQTLRLPPAHRVSTGFAYDIVAHVPRDVEALNTVDLMETRPWRIRTRLQTEDRLRSAGEERSALESTRALNVARLRRYEENSDARGYDVISGLGRPASVLEGSLAGRVHSVSAWDRIERDLAGSSSLGGTTRGGGDFGRGE